MDKININNLAGKCLAALPSTEGLFAKSLVYICTHNDDSGAMGLILNKPYPDITLNELTSNIFSNTGIGITAPILQGGPLERDKGFIIHDESYIDSTSFRISDGIVVSSSTNILHNIAVNKEPLNFLIVLGYCGWIPGQLENEISQNRWLIVPTTPELVFQTPVEEKWSLALSSLGINNSNFTLPLGHS